MIYVSELEKLKTAKELRLRATPGFGSYKPFFPPEAVSHPAKMNTSLLAYLIRTYTKEGDTICDPMGGTASTAVLGALHNRNVVVVELEDKFVKWGNAAAEKVANAPTLFKGNIKIIKGDARSLSHLLGEADVGIFSPPYNTRTDGSGFNKNGIPDGRGLYRDRPDTLKYSDDRENNIGEIRTHGDVETVITSPPYANSAQGHNRDELFERLAADPTSARFGRKSHPTTAEPYSDNPENLGNLPFGQVDTVITSPAYADSAITTFDSPLMTEHFRKQLKEKGFIEFQGKRYTEKEWRAMNHGRIDGRTTKGLDKGSIGYSQSEQNLGNLSMGKVDEIISSPPFAQMNQDPRNTNQRKIARDMEKKYKRTFSDKSMTGVQSYSESSNNIGNLIDHGNIDSIVTSPPYEESEAFEDSDFMKKISGDTDEKILKGEAKGHLKQSPRTLKYKAGAHASQGHAPSSEAEAAYMERVERGRIEHPDSIGKLKKETYLEAMARVYREQFKVLKPGGRAVIVIKPFSRNKKVVDLPYQTWLLLRSIGFELEEVLKLRLEHLSFWRTIQYRRDPTIPQIRHEYILVCRKSG